MSQCEIDLRTAGVLRKNFHAHTRTMNKNNSEPCILNNVKQPVKQLALRVLSTYLSGDAEVPINLSNASQPSRTSSAVISAMRIIGRAPLLTPISEDCREKEGAYSRDTSRPNSFDLNQSLMTSRRFRATG